MSSGIFTPINQVKLTNVSVVRLKKAGRRFELACYKNKLMDYRSGMTTNLDDVLQSPHIFSNVPKGLLASAADLSAAFPNHINSNNNNNNDITTSANKEAIIREILEKGQVQVGEREREHQLGSLQREIATMVAERCLNPNTNLPYPVSVIERTITEELHYSIKQEKNAKQMALEIIKLLPQKSSLPIVRARMRIIISNPSVKAELIQSFGAVIESEADDKLIFTIDPGHFRGLQSFAQERNLNISLNE